MEYYHPGYYKRYRKTPSEFRTAIKKGYVIFFVLTINIVLFFKFFDPKFTPLMVIRSIESLEKFQLPSINHQWTSIDKISTNAIYAVLAGEDNGFVSSLGFDIKGISQAWKTNIQNKKIVIGGSTISQQTAKNVFLWPSRSYIRKSLEVYFTVLIELLRDKERIMEIYLNIVELGDNIYGVESASQIYFNKPSSKLTQSQAALLTALLPNPRYFDDNQTSRTVTNRKRAIMLNMYRLKQQSTNRSFIKEIKN